MLPTWVYKWEFLFHKKNLLLRIWKEKKKMIPNAIVASPKSQTITNGFYAINARNGFINLVLESPPTTAPRKKNNGFVLIAEVGAHLRGISVNSVGRTFLMICDFYAGIILLIKY